MSTPREIEPHFRELAARYPVITVTGPRQSGKTTLCRRLFPEKPYVNLEALDTRAFATEDPRGFLAAYRDGAVLDEIQRAPELLSYLQVEVDADPAPGRFVLTGSQQFEVMSNVSQSLAGRTAMLKLLPFSLAEIEPYDVPKGIDSLIHRGFYPRIYDQGLDPTQALGDYLETYVQRDLRQLVNLRDLGAFDAFLRLCAGRVGQLLNLQSLANDVGVSHTTIRNWITLLEASYVLFQLRPWHTNLGKRLVKSPKLYFYDVGLAAYLLGIEKPSHAASHPLRGNLFENLVVIEALKHRYNRGRRDNLHFYRDSGGNEVDLLIGNGPSPYPVEIKAGATISRDYFKGLDRFAKVCETPHGGAVVYGGEASQPRSDWEVRPLAELTELLGRIETT